MIDIEIKGRPACRDEIRQALTAIAAFEGKSLATLAVNELQLAPYVLKSLLNGITKPSTHLATVQKINELTGADMSAWEK
jgi:hypothetical protein